MLENKYIPYGTDPELDKLVDSDDYNDRKKPLYMDTV